jgi:hypothetical protein
LLHSRRTATEKITRRGLSVTKTIVVRGDKEITVYSIDGGQSWASDVKQLQLRERQREKRRKKELRFAKTIFRASYLNKI